MDKRATAHDLCSVLPSYPMYNAIYRLISVVSNPPDYSVSSERTSLLSYQTEQTGETDLHDAVIDHLPELKYIGDSENPYAKALDLSIHFIKNVGKISEPAEPLDPLREEYNRDDFLHGYVIVENTTDLSFKFDMFYLLLEGYTTVSGHAKPPFLQMFDFNASGHPGSIGRFSHCKSSHPKYDAMDDTYLTFRGFQIEPKKRYKRFFTFKIPEFLIDLSCRNQCHCHLPPTVGASDDVFPGTSIKYSVLANVIGRLSYYGGGDDNEHYVVLKRKEFSDLRVVQREVAFDSIENRLAAETSKLIFLNIKSTAEGFVDTAKSRLNPELPLPSLHKHIYRRDSHECQEYNQHRMIKPSRWTSRGGGIFTVSMPKRTILLDYITPYEYRSKWQHETTPTPWKVKVPFTLSFNCTEKPPEIKYLFFDFVTVTYQLKHPIPMELHHELVYGLHESNSVRDVDELQCLVAECKDLCGQVVEILKKVPDLSIEKRLCEDLKGICSIQLKESVLVVTDVTLAATESKPVTLRSVNSIPWVAENCELKKFMVLDINFDSMEPKCAGVDLRPVWDRKLLMPLFHLCYMGRMYFLRVLMGLTSGEFIHLKMPVHISKPWLENHVEGV